MSHTLGGRVHFRSTPALYRFLGRIDLRSFHGRAMLCSLIERALVLTPQDKQRYSALLVNSISDASDGTGARRFTVSIVESEFPDVVAALNEYGAENCKHQKFMHLLEVAAGILSDDGKPATPVAGTPAVAAVTPQRDVKGSSPPPAAAVPKTPPAIPVGSERVIASSMDHGAGVVMQADDLELFERTS